MPAIMIGISLANAGQGGGMPFNTLTSKTGIGLTSKTAVYLTSKA